MARTVPADLEDALAASPAARERFWSMPAEQKDSWIAYVARARMPGARRRRVAETVRRLGGPAPAAAVEQDAAAAVALPREDWSVWLIGLALLAGLAGFLLWLTVFRNDGSSKASAVVVTSKSTVPKVTGIRYQAAQFQLKDAKLASTITRRNAAKPKGIVVAQTPKNGTSVPQGTAVALVVSNGPPGVAMPDLVGLAAADAVKALQARKLTPTLHQTASNEAPGTVLAQEPKAGKRAKPGTPVVLEVAKGNASVAVPDVTGRMQQDAVATLRGAGFGARVVQVPSTQSPGTVLAQSPAAGQKLARGASVRLNVAKGAQPATTTSRRRRSRRRRSRRRRAHAGERQRLHRHAAVGRGAEDRRRQAAGDRHLRRVVAAAGRRRRATRAQGSRERLQVSAGPHPKPVRDVPDVTSEDAATAQQDLEDAGFTVIQADWPVSRPERGRRRRLRDAATTGQVPGGAAVVIYVGSAG